MGVAVLAAMVSVAAADPSYVQALPSNNSAAHTDAAINQTNQTGNDAFGQQIDQIQPIDASKAKAAPTAQTQTTSAATPAVAASSMDQSAQNTLLLSRVMQVNQDFLNFQSKANSQMTELQTANQQLAQQVSTLATQLQQVQNQVTSISQGSANNATTAQVHTLSNIEDEIGVVPFYIIAGIFILLVVIIVLLLLPRKKSVVTEAPKADVKSDYDYLSTKEAIPAKLDLARSYIVMEDFDAAKKVLAEVLKAGDDKQQALANDLLKECEPKKDDA